MSSRIVTPGEHEITLPAWRQALAAGAAAGASAPADASEEIARLQHQWEQRVIEARSVALREGEAAGRTRATAELQPVLERVARSIEEIAGLRPKLRREAESDMLRLSLAIARRILRREIATDPEAMHGLVLAALEKLQKQEISRVRVHPSHVEPITAYLRQATAGSVIEVIADGSRPPGTAVFETTHGNLDASVDTQLQEIERGLIDRLNRQS